MRRSMNDAGTGSLPVGVMSSGMWNVVDIFGPGSVGQVEEFVFGWRGPDSLEDCLGLLQVEGHGAGAGRHELCEEVAGRKPEQGGGPRRDQWRLGCLTEIMCH